MIFTFPESKTGWGIFVSVMSAITPLIIGLLGAYIAWQQWKTNERKLKSELYPQRKEIYSELMQFLAKVASEGTADFPHAMEMMKKASDNAFLFDKKTVEYLWKIYSKATELHAIGRKLNQTQPEISQEERQRLVDKSSKTLVWLGNQPGVATKKFRRYLRLS